MSTKPKRQSSLSADEIRERIQDLECAVMYLYQDSRASLRERLGMMRVKERAQEPEDAKDATGTQAPDES